MPAETVPTSVRFSNITNQEISAAQKAINTNTKMSRAAVIDLAVQRGIPVLLKALGIPASPLSTAAPSPAKKRKPASKGAAK